VEKWTPDGVGACDITARLELKRAQPRGVKHHQNAW
jgi:hypothetical protein